MEISLCNQPIILHPSKALFWPSQKTLILSDVHLGKVSHFRRNGISVPTDVRFHNLLRIDQLIDHYNPLRVIFLGDLFHSSHNLEWEEFGHFIGTYPSVKFELVRGNHDVLAKHHYEKFDILMHTEHLRLDPFLLTHEPMESPNELYNLCGHIHPGVRLSGKGRQSIKLPCFFFAAHQGILPAFGDFTGKYMLRPKKSDQVFVIARNSIVDVSASTSTRD